MKKILYAINHRQTEDAITERIGNEYLPVGAVTYKEAVLEQLKNTGADTLLIRESLPGSTPMERLLNRIRIEQPNLRIIVICFERPKQDPFLQQLVNWAIYDIINSDKPTLSEICSYILTPRTYRDAAQYGIGLPTPPGGATPITRPTSHTTAPACPTDPAKESAKKGNFFDDLKKGFAAFRKPAASGESTEPAKPTQAASITPNPLGGGVNMPQVDFDLLRESIKESEARKAQEGLDKIIQEAVEKQTAALRSENETLKKQLLSVEVQANDAESHASTTVEELNSIRAEADRLRLTLDDERKRTQAVIDMYETQIRALQNPTNTPEWYSEQSALWETQKTTLTAQLTDKTKESEEWQLKAELTIRQLQEANDRIAKMEEEAQRTADMQLSERGSDELIAKLRAETSEVKAENAQLTKDLEILRAEFDNVRGGGPDFSYPAVEVPLLPDDAVYTTPSAGPQTIMMVGSKHGVGNTTIALNLAASLAGRGYKTLLVELDANMPMLNSYFEFTHVPYGLEECVNSIANGQLEDIGKAIIRPHGLSPAQIAVARTYKKLPAGLHFLLFSNESLVKHSFQNNPHVTEANIYTFLSYLTKRLQYSYIILDIRCDDSRILSCLVNSGYQINKLCVTLSQDPHAVASAGSLIKMLAQAHASSLVAAGEFIINRFNPSIPVPVQKIERLLRLTSGQITKINEDSSGYYSAAHAALPYLQNNGRFRMDFDSLRSKIAPQSN